MNNATEILKYAINMEKKAQEFYDFYKDKVSSKKIKDLFEGLASMEEVHSDILTKQLVNYESNHSFLNIDLSKLDGEYIIKTKENDLKNVDFEYDLSDLPILRMAHSMENDFAIFYEKALEQTNDPQAIELLTTLSKWEKEHRDSFETEIKNAMQSSWFSQSFYPF